MRKRLYSFVIFILLLMLNSFAFAQSPQISNGLSWLYSAQTTNGNWPEVATTDYYSTAAALDAIYSVDPSNPAYGPAFQWLSTQLVSPTDYLSRQIIALKRAGQDTSGYVASLLLYRNSDGGFGGANGYPNSYIRDTALALQALHAANYSDMTVIGQSLNYLTSNQNADGGWGALTGEASSTYISALVLKALNIYSSIFINQNSINQASAFLLAHQNTDGGFGDSPSKVYATALSLMSLIESGQGSTQTILGEL
jgi:large repetitive protein